MAASSDLNNAQLVLPLAKLEPSAQAVYTILEKFATPRPEVRRTLLSPPAFFFKIFFLSRMLEVRFPLALPQKPDLLAKLVERAASKLNFHFPESEPCLTFAGAPLADLHGLPNGALLQLAIAEDSQHIAHNPTLRQSVSKVRARRLSNAPRVTKKKKVDPEAQAPASTPSPADQKERYNYQVEEEKTAPGCGGEQVLSLDSELEYAERYNYDMYEDYALISLKLKNRQRHNRRFRCPFQKCWKLFKESGNLSTHIRSHTGTRPFQCEQCGQEFIAKGHLDSHLLKHKGHKPFVCSFPGCGKQYGRANRLKVHERTHTGEKPFVCDICDRAFTDKTNLLTHLRIHSGERPFVCSCGKTFVKQSHLADHQKCHDESKPFQCPYCTNSFKRKRTLNYHMAHKHQQQQLEGEGEAGEEQIVTMSLPMTMKVERGRDRDRERQSATAATVSFQAPPRKLTRSQSPLLKGHLPPPTLLTLAREAEHVLPGLGGMLDPLTQGSVTTRPSTDRLLGASPRVPRLVCAEEPPSSSSVLIKSEMGAASASAAAGAGEDEVGQGWASVRRKKLAPVGGVTDIDRTNSLQISRVLRKTDSLQIARSPVRLLSPAWHPDDSSPQGAGGAWQWLDK